MRSVQDRKAEPWLSASEIALQLIAPSCTAIGLLTILIVWSEAPPLLVGLIVTIHITLIGFAYRTNRMRISRLLATNAVSDDLAHRDYLTGLRNRRGLDRFLKLLDTDSDHTLHYAVIDVDNFKQINDQLGHEGGDHVLIALGSRISRLLGRNWFVARTGGDEFVAVSESGSIGAIEKMQAELTHAAPGDDARPVRTSIGLAIGRWSDDLWRDGLAAVGLAKRRGKHNLFVVEGETRQRLHAERLLSAQVQRAIRTEEITIWAQPIAHFDQRVAGYECLARWEMADGLVIEPAVFVPFIEDQGLAAELGETVIRQAAAFARTLPEGVWVSVNVSSSHFESGELVPLVSRVIEETGLDPATLVIEITESQHVRDDAAWLRAAQELSALGVGLAVDDFGRGYSSMSRLLQLQFSVLKLDPGLVASCTSPASHHTVLALTHFAKEVGATVIAEGVESQEQADVLERQGVDLAQGFWFGRPEPLHRIDPLTSVGAIYQRLAQANGA